MERRGREELMETFDGSPDAHIHGEADARVNEATQTRAAIHGEADARLGGSTRALTAGLPRIWLISAREA